MNEQLVAIHPHPSKRISDQVADDPSIINLTVGEPLYQPPAALGAALISRLQHDASGERSAYHRYADSRGTAALRRAIAERYHRLYQASVDPDLKLLVTNGAAEAIWLAVFSLTNPGDEVLIPDPAYMLYEPIVLALGRQPVRIPTSVGNKFCLELNGVEKALTPKTRLLILNSPANPTGVVYDGSLLAALGRLTEASGVYVLHDEVFDRCVFEGKHTPLQVLMPEATHLVTVNSFSKTFGMTGWRLGWMMASPEVIMQAAKAHTYSCLAVSTLVQEAASDMLNAAETAGFIESNKTILAEQSRWFTRALCKINGFECPLGSPCAGFYVFADVNNLYQFRNGHGAVSESVAKMLLEICKVAVVPGNAFGPSGDGYVRISIACDRTRLTTALERLSKAFGFKSA